MAPDTLKGVWRFDPLQRSFLPRLRCLLGPTVAQPKHKLAGKVNRICELDIQHMLVYIERPALAVSRRS